jgi:serine/threonine protein kinase/Tfp pilus assembly protein PilF
MIGQQISHFEILEKIGEGGMGVVYKARDLQLGRDVVLKFLSTNFLKDEDAKTRFVQEARAAAALDHSNICTVYGIHQDDARIFIAMSLIDGKSLKDRMDEGPLELGEALDIAAQMAEGLQEAHLKGIVHRDVKPSNIMINSRGQVKIMDFGLAKMTWEEDLTKTASIVGTVKYMSPEQAQGEKLNAQTDIWSWGVVFYELLTGVYPFKGYNELSVLFSILNENPQPPSRVRGGIPPYIDHVVLKALNKNKTRRFMDFEELLKAMSDSSFTSIVAEPNERSIAVLPFDDISPKKDNEYFSDGLTEEIITDLSKVKCMRVISRNSAMVFKGKRKDSRTIGRELDVQYILEGSVRKADQRIRVSAQLINAHDDSHLWAEKFDGTMEDVFDIQEKVSQAVVKAICRQISPEEEKQMTRRPLDDPYAFECYLKAKQEVMRWDVSALERAVKYLENGLEVVGPHALFYAGLGYVYYQYANMGIDPENALNKAESFTRKAFEQDSDSPQGHFLMGIINQALKGNQQAGIIHLKRALALEPNDLDTMVWLGLGYATVGHPEKAKPLLQKIRRVDPLSEQAKFGLPGLVALMDGRFEKAGLYFEEGLREKPHNLPWHIQLCMALILSGQHYKAAVHLKRVKESGSPGFFTLFMRALRQALKEDKDAFTSRLVPELLKTAAQDPMYSYFIAVLFALFQDEGQTLRWLENARDRGFLNYPLLSKHDPLISQFGGNPDFRLLLQRIKQEWESFDL